MTGQAPADGSCVDDDCLDVAHDTLERVFALAKKADAPEVLFADITLDDLEQLREHRPHAMSALLAGVRYEWKAEILRLLRDRAKAVHKDETEACDDDWPGSGSTAHFFTEPAPPRRWLAHERLPANRAGVLAGIGGSSKTRFLFHSGVGAVLGQVPWGWQIERTGTAALFLSEDTAEDVWQTLWSMAEAMDLSGEECALLVERLFIFPMAGRDVRLLASVGGDLITTGRYEALLRALRALPPPLVFVGLDPALAFTDGDELNQAHQRRLGELVDRMAIELDAAVLLATHAGKTLQNADEIGSHAARGGGALTDAVRAEYVLRTMTAAEARTFGIDSIEERKAHVQLVATKGNALPPSAFAPVWMRRGSGGVLEPADLVRQETTPIGPREIAALDVLRDLAAVQTPLLRAWREACINAKLVSGSNDRAKEKSMDRIRDALLGAGLIERGTARGIYLPKAAE